VKDAATRSGSHLVWLWGGEGSGRSHLLQAAVAAATAQNHRSAWLPLSMEGLVPEMLEGMGQLDLLCVDDVDAVAGDAAWERALFNLFEELRVHDARLIVTAGMPANDVAFDLPDIKSRLASGATWRLNNMNDDELLAALQLRSNWRGLDLPDETGQFLLKRVERSTKSLFTLLDKLDHEALTAKRKLTVPFVSSVLDSVLQG
ncbi:MAG: DnaA regulatory inactivator Hda, partial [Gammaproteobacteria bacterium]